jgi:hypothetical protein
MAEEPHFYILKPPFLPSSTLPSLLARIVKNPAAPHADYTPSSSPASTLISFPAPPLTSSLLLPNMTLHSATSSSTMLHLSSLISAQRSRERGNDVLVTGEEMRTIRLQCQEETFEALRKVPEVRERLSRMLRIGGKVFFVVGVLVLRDFRVGVVHTEASGNGAAVDVPVEAAMMAAGVAQGMVPGLGVLLGDVGLSSDNQTKRGLDLEGQVEGEQIVGLEYRVVRRRMGGFGGGAKVGGEKVRFEGGRYYGQHSAKVEDDEDGEEDEDEDGLGDLVLTGEWVEGYVAGDEDEGELLVR